MKTHDNTSSAYAVETAGITKRFGAVAAVDNVDLLVPRGSAFGYLGPNGAGKTTLIRMLLGLARADAGSMRILGLAVPDERQRALARVGAIVEEPRFHGYLTGQENLHRRCCARAGSARPDRRGARPRRLDRARDDRVKTYSLGMRQRLGVARALLGDPELLILDEPTNGLDPAGIYEFRDMIGGLVAEGRTVMLSSHLLDEVEKICDSAAIVDRGTVITQGSISELKGGGMSAVFGVDDQQLASRVLTAHASVSGVDALTDGLRVRLAGSADQHSVLSDLNRLLVEQHVSVHRLEPEP